MFRTRHIDTSSSMSADSDIITTSCHCHSNARFAAVYTAAVSSLGAAGHLRKCTHVVLPGLIRVSVGMAVLASPFRYKYDRPSHHATAYASRFRHCMLILLADHDPCCIQERQPSKLKVEVKVEGEGERKVQRWRFRFTEATAARWGLGMSSVST